jgi:hypothetical protein
MDSARLMLQCRIVQQRHVAQRFAEPGREHVGLELQISSEDRKELLCQLVTGRHICPHRGRQRRHVIGPSVRSVQRALATNGVIGRAFPVHLIPLVEVAVAAVDLGTIRREEAQGDEAAIVVAFYREVMLGVVVERKQIHHRRAELNRQRTLQVFGPSTLLRDQPRINGCLPSKCSLTSPARSPT